MEEDPELAARSRNYAHAGAQPTSSTRPMRFSRIISILFDLVSLLLRSDHHRLTPRIRPARRLGAPLPLQVHQAVSQPRRHKLVGSEAGQQYTVVPDDVMRSTSIERFLVKMEEEQPIRFTAEQLAGFTRDYSDQLGRGGFGTVYRGMLPNGLAVAVKVLRGDRKTSEEQFMAEMTAIGRTHHINLVRLYGFCFDDAAATHALVYEFMEHGALGDYLSAHGPGLSMATAADIATGVARGLAYLHEECQRKIVHHDIKPGNVLLDGSLTPKVADFGLARLLSRADTHASLSGLRGTPGYTAPEVWREFRFTEKCDVYSFGILLLDITRRGRKLEDMEAAPESESSQRWFPLMAWTRYQAGELMELVGRHGEDEPRRCRELVERMCKVAFWCVQERPPARPSMSAVVKMLEGEMDIAPPPYPFQHLFAPASAANLRMAMASNVNTVSSSAATRRTNEIVSF